MKKETKKSNLIIIVMGILLVILMMLCFYLTFRVINNESKVNNINNNVNNNTSENINTNNEYIISYKEETLTKTNSSGKISVTNKRNIPSITNKNNPDAAKKIETKLKLSSDNYWKTLGEAAEEYKDTPYEIGVNYYLSTGVSNNNRLSFIGTEDGDFGGVSWSSIDGYNFDSKTGETLTYESISNNHSEFINVITTLTINDINKQNSENDLCLHDDSSTANWSQEIKDNINSYSWVYTDNGIRIFVSKYSIACGAAGVITVDINKNDVNSYLLDKYKI